MRDFDLRERAAKVLSLMADGERRMADLARQRDEAVRAVLSVGADIGRMEARIEVLREEYDELSRLSQSDSAPLVAHESEQDGEPVPQGRTLKLPDGWTR